MSGSLMGLLETTKSTLPEHLEYVLEATATKIDIDALGLWIVIGLAFLGIAQSIIGLLYLLETGLITAAIRVMLHGQAAICAFDIFGADITCHT